MFDSLISSKEKSTKRKLKSWWIFKKQSYRTIKKMSKLILTKYNAVKPNLKWFYFNKEPTIKLLRDRIKELEEKNESQVASKLKERERDLQKSFAEKEEQFQSSQLDLVKKLGETEARLASMQSQLQKSQADLYELKSKQDELLNAKSLEIDMLMQDIDKLNERVASAERLSEQYAKKLAEREARETEVNDEKKAEIEQQQEKLIGYQTTALEIELAAKDKEISQLVDDVQKLQMKSNKMREFYEQQRIDLEDKLSARERSLEQLEYDLKKKLDYDEVRFFDQNLSDQNL